MRPTVYHQMAVVTAQSICHVLLAAPRTASCQASLSITNSQSLLKLMSIARQYTHTKGSLIHFAGSRMKDETKLINMYQLSKE